VWQMARMGLNHLGLTDTQAAAAVTRQMVGQAYLLASTDIFYVSAWLCIVLAGLTWFTPLLRALAGCIWCARGR